MKEARFLRIWACTLALSLGALATFNIFTDPYDIFAMRRIEGLNAHKPTATDRTPMVKSYQVERVAPHTLLLGSSRVDIGLDPDLSAWPREARPVYNYGVPGISPRGMLQNLQQVAAGNSLRLVIIGLDFEDFLSDAPDEPIVIEALGISTLERNKQRLTDALVGTFTLSAFLDSIGTVVQQNRQTVGDITVQGKTSEGPFLRLVASDGQYDLFTQKDLAYTAKRMRDAQELATVPPDKIPELAYVRAMIEFCRARGITVFVFISPSHADLLEILNTAGLWDRFESWKRALVDLVEGYHSGIDGPPVILWDFSGYNSRTTEVVPPKGDRTTLLKWFWEPAHYRKALGDIMLKRMLGDTAVQFGVELSRESLGTHLASMREDRQAYREQHPEETRRVARLIEEVHHPNR